MELKTYQLYINLSKDMKIEVGKLGTYTFYKGNYIYTGSAKKKY